MPQLVTNSTWTYDGSGSALLTPVTLWLHSIGVARVTLRAPVFPVFFMVVWLDDSALNFSSISSWYSSETTACSSVISTGDWFFAAHSGYEAAQPLGPWLPAETKTAEALMKNLDYVPKMHVWSVRCDRSILYTTLRTRQRQRQLGFKYALNGYSENEDDDSFIFIQPQ